MLHIAKAAGPGDASDQSLGLEFLQQTALPSRDAEYVALPDERQVRGASDANDRHESHGGVLGFGFMQRAKT